MLLAAIVGLAALGGVSYFAYDFFAGGDDAGEAQAPVQEEEAPTDILEVPEELTDLQIAALDRGSVVDPSVIASRVGLLPANSVNPGGLSSTFVNQAVAFCSGESDEMQGNAPDLSDPDELIIIQHPDAQGQWFPHYQTRYSGDPEFVTCVETQPESSLRDVCVFADIPAEPPFEDDEKEFGLYEMRWTAVSYETSAGTPVKVTRPDDVIVTPSGCPEALSVPGDGNTLFPDYVNPFEYDGETPDPALASEQPLPLFAKFYAPLPAAFARTDIELAGPESAASAEVTAFSGPAGTRFIQMEAAHLCATGQAPKAGYVGNTREGDFMVAGTEIVNDDPLTLPDLISCFESSRGDQISNCTYVIDPLLETKRDEPIFALDWSAKVFDRQTGELSLSTNGVIESLPEDVCPNRWQPGVAIDSERPVAVAGGEVDAEEDGEETDEEEDEESSETDEESAP